MYVCLSSVYTNIGKLQTWNTEPQICAQNVLSSTWEVRGFHLLLFPFRSYTKKKKKIVFLLYCFIFFTTTFTYILSPSCVRSRKKETQFAVQHKGGISKINNPTVFCIFFKLIFHFF